MEPIDLSKTIYMSLHKRLPKHGEFLNRSEIEYEGYNRITLDNTRFTEANDKSIKYVSDIRILIGGWCQPSFVMLSYHSVKGKSSIGGFEIKVPECNEGDILVLKDDVATVIPAPPPDHTLEEVNNMKSIFSKGMEDDEPEKEGLDAGVWGDSVESDRPF